MSRTVTLARVVWLDMLRRKDFYVLLILLGILLVALVSMNIFGLGDVTSYVADIGLLLAWVFSWILSISIGCRLLPQEESRGTIFALLAKPVTRFDLIMGKWLGAWSAASLATLLFYLLIFAVTMLRGWTLSVGVAIQAIFLHSLVLAMITAAGVMFSTRMNSDAAATLTGTLTACAFFLVPRIPEFVAQTSGLRAGLLLFLYNLLPHFEIFDLRMRVLHNYGTIPTATLLMVTGYGLLITAIFLGLAWTAYREKRFTRGSLSGY